MTMSAVSKYRDTEKACAPFGKVLPAPITDSIPPSIKALTKSPRSIVNVGMCMASFVENLVLRVFIDPDEMSSPPDAIRPPRQT
ncbi:MAG: hypothetical protein AB1429_01025 [Pseudomonadota bacterium]|jgi:hypothetical protein